MAKRNHARPSRLIEAERSASQRHHSIVETRHGGRARASIACHRDSIDAAQIIGPGIPSCQIENEVASAGELIQLAVQAEPERRDSRAEVR